jgi:hypothetical protein
MKNMSQQSSALSILFEGGETLAICDSTNIVAKKPQPLLWSRIEKGAGEKGKSVTTSS